MTRYLKTALLAAAALLASCIHNDIPYPVVELRIASVEGQGFSVSENNVTSRTVTLSLDEATDIRNVRIDAVGYDAVIHSIQLDKEEVLQQIRSSRELTGTFDLRSPIYTTLSLYQDYEWTIRATQTIKRRFSVTGQIGATEIEEKNRIARVLVPSDTDLAHIEVTELKLGPADITTYSPSLEELSGSSFESVRFVDVTCHGITERWLLYVEPTNVKVALRATDLWNNTATATALVSAAGAALEYRIKGATEWQRMAESSYEAGILTATLAPEWSSSTNPHGLAVYNFVPDKGLFAGHTYEFRLTVGGEQTQLMEYAAPAGNTIPNGDLEDSSLSCWTQNNKTAEFWGSGNNTFTRGLCTQAPFDGGTRAKLQATSAVGVLASGNLFTGLFQKDLITRGVVSFGQTYAWKARPRALKVQYFAEHLGPVDIDKKFGAPLITNDGVTIAKEIELDDPFENMGAQLVREVSTKTNDVAGDGTTTATLLAQAMVREGLKNLAAGANPVVMKKGMAKAVETAVSAIKANSQKVNGTDDIARVGTVSSGDEFIGKLIAEAMEKVSADGVITIEESKTAETYSEVVEGMMFDRGYITPYMVTDTEKMEAVIDDAYLLITDKKISVISDILPILEQLVQSGKKLVIIAEDVEGEALSTLIVNRLRGTLNVVCVKAPGFGDRRKEMLQDIAILTGGQVISEELGYELKNTTIDMLGRARQIKVTKENTTIVDGAGDKQAIADRVAQIRAQIGVTTSEYDKEKLQERLAKLAGGVAVIKVGAATETEMKEKKLRIEDALNATRAAVEEGIVAGGGTAYVNAVPAVEKLISEVEGDEKTGVQIIVKALQEPIRQIAANAGIDGSVVLEKIKTSGKVGYGFDAYKEVYCDMISAGIVDPAKVTRSALENAASVSSMVLTTEALVADKPEPPAPAAPGAGMGDMGGMY